MILKMRRELENNCSEKKTFLYSQNFSAEISSLLLAPHNGISLPLEVRNNLKQGFVDMNSMLPGDLFVSHIIHIFVSYMYFS